MAARSFDTTRNEQSGMLISLDVWDIYCQIVHPFTKTHMIDPLSVTLAVVSLATALKDLIEVADKLYNLFKKSSHLLQDAKTLAIETLEIAQDLEKFYQIHRDNLENLADVRDAILCLLRDMKLVYNSCLPVFEDLSPPETKFRKMMSRLELWKSRKALEKRIGNLRDQAKKCYRQFMIRTQLGMAVAVAELKKRPTHQVSDEKVLDFIGSAPTILSKLPPDVVLSEHLVYQLNIRIQVGKVDNTLKALSNQSAYPVEEPNLFHLSTMKTIIGIPRFTPDVVDYMQSDILMNIIQLQQYLNTHVDAISVQGGARTMNMLTVAISQLGMYEEAVTMGRWAIVLYRTLYQSNREVYAPCLALQLYNFSIDLMNTNDLVLANTTTEECLAILKTCAPTSDIEPFLANALSHAAYLRARLNGDSQETLKNMQESVAVFERLLGNQQCQLTITNPNQPRQRFTIFMESDDLRMYSYARALQRLHSGLCAVGRHEEALRPGQKALELCMLLARRCNSLELYTSIAFLGSSLCHDRYRPQLSAAQALLYIQESGQKLELILIRPGGTGSMNYIISLRKEAEILTELGRSEEAYAVFQKIVRVGPSMVNNQRTYLPLLQSLTLRFHGAGFYREALMTSRTVLDLCRPSTKASKNLFIKAVVDHVSICQSLNRLAEGIVCIRELLDSLDLPSDSKHPDIVREYLRFLGWAGILHTEHGQPEWTISQCEAAIGIFSPPTDDDVALWLVHLTVLKVVSLLRLDHISAASEAIKQGEDLVFKYNLQGKSIGYSSLLRSWSLIHRTRGETDDALDKLKTAISLDMADADSIPEWHSLSNLEADAGNDIEALRAAEKAIEATKHFSTKEVVHLEHRYRQAQYSLFFCRLAGGDLPQAKQLITEVRGFYEWHAHSHHAWFINLALALRSEIVLACASDQRLEESMASSKLSDLQHRLRTTLPSVGKQVDIALARQQRYPPWKRLLAKYPMVHFRCIEMNEALNGPEALNPSTLQNI
ncbi:hypothetical protein D9613_004940 [Agrocybe pediades]|uniref:Uncharacterized protein n=1 Tax=Agrocybe pediades TaxID=84607 RepID=A0A8H4VRT1_9AGAR|nr:hypothetical protein D9613_004940 [Agrocybe pediades]